MSDLDGNLVRFDELMGEPQTPDRELEVGRLVILIALGWLWAVLKALERIADRR